VTVPLVPPVSVPPQDVRVRRGVPVLTAAEALQALGLPPTVLRVERWLVERGAFLELNAPVLEATLLDGSGRRVTLLGQHAGVLDRRFPPPGTQVGPDSALMTLSGVRAFVALPQRLTGQETGVLLTLPARPPSLDGSAEACVVGATVAELPTPVRWGSRVVFLLPPGAHHLSVGYPLGGRTGGSARTRVTVAPGRLVDVRYDPPGSALPSPPPSAAGGPGWLHVAS
jgi:hypothetical protein